MKFLISTFAILVLVSAGCSSSTEIMGSDSGQSNDNGTNDGALPQSTADSASADDTTGAEADVETGAETGVETDAETDAETDPETGAETGAETATDTGTLTPPTTDTEGTLIRSLADEQFVSIEKLPAGESADGTVATAYWSVEFDLDTVEWSYSDVVEVGTYSSDEMSSTGIAMFSGREVAFALQGSDLVWDSREYLRTSTVLVDSQESLVEHLNNATYDTVEQFDIGESAAGQLVLGNWSLQFDGEEVLWFVQDTIRVGTYTYTGRGSFQISFGDGNVTAYLLDDEELLFESAVYKKVFVSQFNSQESLTGLLDDKTYQSLEQKPVGETATGAQAFGYWYISFVQDTFTWDYQDISEAGTYQYLDDDTFTAILPDREFTVAVEGDDIVFDGVRYRGNF